MSTPQPPYTLFQIMDGIVHLDDEPNPGPSNKEVLNSLYWTCEYAIGACDTILSVQEAEHIQTIGKRWLERLESGEETDETYERWAKQEIEQYEEVTT